MSGVKILKDSANGKYMIEYSRPLNVSHLVWQDNNRIASPIKGFGLKKGPGGSLAPTPDLDNWGNVLVGAGWVNEKNNNSGRDPIAQYFTAYDAALKSAGLHPVDDKVFLDHSRVRINGFGDNNNVAANGMYDFILAYYNPNEDGNAANVDGIDRDMEDLLPAAWPTSLIFDGLTNAETSRNIGGVTSNSDERKYLLGDTIPSGKSVGMPRNDFVGSMTVPMANFLRQKGVSEFRNTNIIGNGSEWDNAGSNSNAIVFPSDLDIANVGFIGNYKDITSINGNFYGVIDINDTNTSQSSLTSISQQNTTKGYLNIWNNVSRPTSVRSFGVVHIRNLGGEYINTGITGYPNTFANVIISRKYANELVGDALTLKPFYRAFMKGNQVKITDASLGIDSKYVGSSSTQPIPSLVEEDWIKVGNGVTSGFSTGVTYVNGIPQLAPNYANLNLLYKWDDAADFNNNAAVASIASAQSSDTRLAAAGSQRLEAVLPKQCIIHSS